MSPENRERWPTTTSVAIVVINGDRSLLLVHKKKFDQWSLPAGGLQKGETLAEAAYRELQEETGLTKDDIEELNYPNDILIIPGETKTSIGFLYFTRINKVLSPEGIIVEGNEEIDLIRPFKDTELSNLLHKEHRRIYKPEFNIPAFDHWLRWLVNV